MGIPDGAHTHSSGGGGLGTAVLVVLGAALAVKVAGPVVAAVGELVHIMLIAVAVIGGLAAVGLVAFTAYRVRHRRSVDGAARAMLAPQRARAARPLPAPPQAIERTPQVHLHFHGVSAEDVAAIFARDHLLGDLPLRSSPEPGRIAESRPGNGLRAVPSCLWHLNECHGARSVTGPACWLLPRWWRRWASMSSSGPYQT